MSLEIIEESRIIWTVWKIVEDGIEIARFDSRGGYTRADAEAIADEEPEESEEEKRVARAEMYL